jgi:hypothetical protein
MSNKLAVSRLIDVSVVLTPQSAQAQSLNTLLILGSSDIIDVTERIRNYISIDEVAADFGTALPEYFAALLWFEQNPQPNTLSIGRWAQNPTAGLLVGATLSGANLNPATWAAINNGSFGININGAGAVPVNGIDFTGVGNLNAVATAITNKLAGAICTYDAVYNRFKIESVAVGAGSSISFLTPGAATDISVMLGMGIGGGGYQADGIDAETAVAAVTLFDQNYGQAWYAITVLGALDADHLACAAYIEAANNKHIYGISTQETGCISPVDQANIAYLLTQLRYKRSFVQYSSTNLYAVCSALARLINVDYNGNNTVIDLMYKQEPGIVAENLTESQADAAAANNANVFAAYQNNTAIIQLGNMTSGDPADIITDTDWLAVTIQNAIYNLLYTSPTKIPQTDAGIHLIVTTIESVCSQGVTNGMLAAGVWNSAGFGILVQGAFLPKGFYVYAPAVATQLQVDREARKSPPIQVAAKLAGAVRTVDVTINVNR